MIRYISSRQTFALIFIISSSLVGGGLYLAHALRLAACPLCIIQRMLYMVLALVALGGFCLQGHRRGRIVLSLLASDIAGTGAFVAGYQVWLQRYAHDVSCSANEPWWESFVYWAGEKLPSLFEASGLCADPAWKFLSLSIADWSLIAFISLTILAVIAFFKLLRRG